ncbi:ribonuclease H-like domain-containing protein [Fimicolochytrium jonesii]|uniref:ribonuclease H-like domain-containing protein n=1 Tax=Fimicolochytrium jonesii TaxID=1396493 RepID=UPI0022FDC476|nr:ribonuclease H-like domain-containing protein [Fimicolochytrium jonesii]KAI8825287.1 ribonuclease H-like domain-containing protein [Fimicolochytrium jonesii]
MSIVCCRDCLSIVGVYGVISAVAQQQTPPLRNYSDASTPGAPLTPGYPIEVGYHSDLWCRSATWLAAHAVRRRRRSRICTPHTHPYFLLFCFFGQPKTLPHTLLDASHTVRIPPYPSHPCLRPMLSNTCPKSLTRHISFSALGARLFPLRLSAQSHRVCAMEVLRNNLEAFLPKIKDAIEEADFIAIDAEFTGLGIGYPNEYLDTAQDRYTKSKRSTQSYVPIQFGLSTFAWDAAAKQYVAKPFNCYVFPAVGSRVLGLDREFTCQAGSLVFLRQSKLDFNKWISQGIPYLNLDEEERAMHKIGMALSGEDIAIDGQNQDFVDTTMDAIHTWLQTSIEKTVTVSAPTRYHRRLVHQEVRKKYKDSLKTDGVESFVHIRKLTDEERREGTSERSKMLHDELAELVGFRKVLDLISKSRKPVVGHNMMLDLLHTFQSFHKNLPEDVADFRKDLSELFPIIYDTKHLAHSNEKLQPLIMRSSLNDVLQRTARVPFEHPHIVPHPEYASYDTEGENLHEAGYDAYVTGVIFGKLLGVATDLQAGERISWGHESIAAAANKVHMMRSDMPYFDLDGEQEPDRSNVFHISGFTQAVSFHDVQQEFEDLGDISVNQLTKESCYIIVKDRSKVPTVLSAYGSSTSDGEQGRKKNFTYKLATYADHIAPKLSNGVSKVIDAIKAPILQDKGASNGGNGTPSTPQDDETPRKRKRYVDELVNVSAEAEASPASTRESKRRSRRAGT